MKSLRIFWTLTLFPLSLPAHSGLHHYEVASADPDRIFLSFHGDPATTRAVTWRTDPTIAEAYAQIAIADAAPRFDRHADTLKAVTEAVNPSIASNNTLGRVHFHSVIFKNLQPDTLYAYRVGSPDHWSEWIQFRTAKSTPEPFQFTYFGDAQNDVLSHWSRVIRTAYTIAPDSAFNLHAGDLVNRAHRDLHWAEWFKAGGWIHAKRTGIPVTGNHEYDELVQTARDDERILSMLWRPQFTLPVESSLPESLHESVYTVDYQGVRIIVLNSEVVDEAKEADAVEVAAQSEYLRKQLSDPKPHWRIVTFHHPVFSPGGDRDNPRIRGSWKPILDEYGADLVLQGHDHTYARGQVPVRNTSGFIEGTFQTLYVTSVSGPKMYDIKKGKLESYANTGYEPQRIAENTQFFQVIEIEDNRLTYSAYTATGELYDRAIIEKDLATGEKKLRQMAPDVSRRTHENTEPYQRHPDPVKLPEN